MSNFEVQLNAAASEVIPRVRTLLESNGGTLAGDEHSGSFSGSGVYGKYVVEGDTVHISITKKPFLAPMGVVKSKITEYFNSL